MTRLLTKLLLLMLSAMVAMPGNADIELAGYWQHESDPVWIEMRPETGDGVMLRNDNRPDRVGFLVVTDLVAGDDPAEWSAQVFAARLGEYRKADITLASDDRMMSIRLRLSFHGNVWIDMHISSYRHRLLR